MMLILVNQRLCQSPKLLFFNKLSAFGRQPPLAINILDWLNLLFFDEKQQNISNCRQFSRLS